MPQYTSNMNLYKVDLETDGNSTFNIMTMLNDNWDKIDSNYDEQEGRIRGNSEVVNEVKEDVGDKSELKTEDKSSLVGAVNEVSSGMADIANVIVATGTGTVITLSMLSITAYTANMKLTFIASADNSGGATTIDINSLGAKNLYKPNTTTAPNLKSGKPYTVWYNGTHFFLQASAEGNALAEHVLAGKTFSNDDDTGIVGVYAINEAEVQQYLLDNKLVNFEIKKHRLSFSVPSNSKKEYDIILPFKPNWVGGYTGYLSGTIASAWDFSNLAIGTFTYGETSAFIQSHRNYLSAYWKIINENTMHDTKTITIEITNDEGNPKNGYIDMMIIGLKL